MAKRGAPTVLWEKDPKKSSKIFNLLYLDAILHAQFLVPCAILGIFYLSLLLSSYLSAYLYILVIYTLDVWITVAFI